MIDNIFDKFWHFLYDTHGSSLLIGLDAEAERTGRKRKERGEREDGKEESEVKVEE